MRPSESLLSVPEVREILKIGNTKTWALIKSGDLEAVRLGARCTRVKRSSVDRLIQNGQGEGEK